MYLRKEQPTFFKVPVPATHVFNFKKLASGLRPLVLVRITNPENKRWVFVEALLDTGADKSVFTKFIPDQTGHTLDKKSETKDGTFGVVGTPFCNRTFLSR